MEIKDIERISQLLDIYKNLLTDYQKEIMDLYFIEDWSLQEIAQLKGVTRNAVLSTIKRVRKTLNDYEEKLGLNNKLDQIRSIVKKSTLDKEAQDEIISKIEELI